MSAAPRNDGRTPIGGNVQRGQRYRVRSAPPADCGVHLLGDDQWEARCECEWTSGPRAKRSDALVSRTWHLRAAHGAS